MLKTKLENNKPTDTTNVNHSVWNYWQLRVAGCCNPSQCVHASYKISVVGLKQCPGYFSTHSSTWLLIIEVCWSLFWNFRDVSSGLPLEDLESVVIYVAKTSKNKDKDIVIKVSECCHSVSSRRKSFQGILCCKKKKYSWTSHRLTQSPLNFVYQFYIYFPINIWFILSLHIRLKQHYETLFHNDELCFIKDACFVVQNSNFSEISSYFTERVSSALPLMSSNCSASTLWFTEVPESNM